MLINGSGDFAEFTKALNSGNLDLMKRLYKCTFVNMVNIKYKYSSLHLASYHGNIDIVKYLLDKGWDMEKEDYYQYRPIHYASLKGQIDVIKELINRECILVSLDITGKSALDCAKLFNKKECTTILEEALKKYQTVPLYNEHSKIGQIGCGAFGKVYKCFDDKCKKHFAAKEFFIKSNYFDEPKNIKSLENEIFINKTLSIHQNIVRFYGSWKDETYIYIIMEYLDGGTLLKKIKIQGPFSINYTAWYSKQILEGLKFLHGYNIMHRDIKADNIVLNNHGILKLCDFGTSRCLQTICGQKGAITCCGTYNWMAPEVIGAEENPQSPYTFAADVWSMGVTIIEMLTKCPIYDNLSGWQLCTKYKSLMKVEYSIIQEIPTELHELLDSIFVIDKNKRATVNALLISNFIVKFASRD